MFSINDASQTGDNTIKIDLTNYALKNETATKIDIESLETKLANKLDADGSHRHEIAEINELTQQLTTKLSNTTTYSYATLLSDSEKINYLEDVKIIKLNITSDKLSDGYIFAVDTTGDLLITLNDVVIATYNKTAGSWIFNGTNLKDFITDVNETLANHAAAINLLISKVCPEEST